MGAIATMKDTVKTRGFFGLYKGYSALLMFTVPKVYVRFGTFTFVQSNILTEKTKFNTLMCGLTAGVTEALLVVTPQETLKTKIIHDILSEKPKFRNLFHGISTEVKAQGFGGIYKGVTATAMR